MDVEKAVVTYVKQVTGEYPQLSPVPAKTLASLPLYLSEAWHLKVMTFLGHALVLAFAEDNTRKGLTPLIKDRLALISYLDKEVVPVLPYIHSYARRDLIKKRIPFITPGKQFFLPMLLTDFRENFAHRPEVSKKAMSWVAQLIVLRHLLHADIMDRPQMAIAEILDYTAMSISKGVGELISLDLCERLAQGRARTINFKFPPETLWKRALTHLRSPIIRRHPVVEFRGKPDLSFLAGLSALSESTTLSHTAPRIIALSNRETKRLLSHDILEICPYESDADLILEGWAYPPELLSESTTADELSLYLSLKEDPDERVQTALAQLMEQREW
ncbi:MAG: hypothetical protein GX130_03590 [Candidatus Hydrogenedens sp.]|jgi:hypothetical protein|nr:hypothetical protein [Candidatus Hydrogenedens sp.]